MGDPSALCSHIEDHTVQPEGYIEWHLWADKMSKTHRQEKCGGCDRYAIWLPKLPNTIPEESQHG